MGGLQIDSFVAGSPESSILMQYNYQDTFPPVTRNLLILNVLMLLAEWVLPRIGIDLVNLLGMHYFEADSFGIHQLVTYMFLHDPGGISHLFFNMFALYMFGGLLERFWGPKKYLTYYLVTGIGAGLVQQMVWFLNMSPEIMPYSDLLITIGASGAIFGLLLAIGMIFPNLPLFILFVPIPVKAKYFVIVYGLIELWGGISGSAFGGGVAHFAHLGGMLFGIVLILIWRKRDKSRADLYY